MDVLKRINCEVNSKSNKPYNGLQKLKIGYHKIICIRESEGKFGRSVIAELSNEIIFLPAYLAKKLSEIDIAKLNSMEEQLYLYFGGKKENNISWIVRLVSESQKSNVDTDAGTNTDDYDKEEECLQEKPIKKKKKNYVAVSSSDEEEEELIIKKKKN